MMDNGMIQQAQEVQQAQAAALAVEQAQAAAQAARVEVSQLRQGLREELLAFAECYLSQGDSEYEALNEIMENNGLGGLPKTYEMEVTVSYTVTVEVEASDSDEAEEKVYDDISNLLSDNLDIDSYDDLSVSEA